MKLRHQNYRQIIIVTFVFAFIATLSFFLTRSAPQTNAADLSNFKVGNIISDYTMGNYNSMSKEDIQNFLRSKVSCSDYDLKKTNAGAYEWEWINERDSTGVNYNYRIHFKYWTDNGWYYTAANYHVEDGHYVCIADERFNGQSAADIIYEVAQNYHINPQVLLVLLQKEQGLITDQLPNSGQYRSATGYGCPDNDVCDSQYYGFKNQLENAASLFRSILDHGSRYKPVGNNYIQFHPDASCGGSTVYIENNATAALYQYTPYQPNQPALDAGYGTGNYCSAYGNRNFYLYFADWFGDPSAAHYVMPAPAPRHEASTVADGTYYIASLLDESKVLDVEDGSTSSQANIQLYEKWGTNNTAQKWSLKYDTYGHFYTITNVGSGKLLDIKGGTISNTTNIWQYNNNGTCSQRWHIIKSIDGLNITNACNENYVLDVTGGIASDHSNIQLYQSNNTKAQQWHFIPSEIVSVEGAQLISDGEYYLATSLDELKVLDVQDCNSANHANVQIYERAGGINNKSQLWNITYDTSSGYYTITSANSQRALDISNASMNNHANIQTYTPNNTCAQHWYIKPINGKMSLISACNSSYVLDLEGGKTSNHTNIQLYQNWSNSAQLWIPIPSHY